MRMLICAGLLALSAGASSAADCNKYVHETDPETWLVLSGDHFVWHKANDGEYAFEIGRYTSEGDPRLIAYSEAKDDGESGEDAFAIYRFAEVNGREALIWETWFYYRACASTS